jgi:hypothetical protein
MEYAPPPQHLDTAKEVQAIDAPTSIKYESLEQYATSNINQGKYGEGFRVSSSDIQGLQKSVEGIAGGISGAIEAGNRRDEARALSSALNEPKQAGHPPELSSENKGIESFRNNTAGTQSDKFTINAGIEAARERVEAQSLPNQEQSPNKGISGFRERINEPEKDIEPEQVAEPEQDVELEHDVEPEQDISDNDSGIDMSSDYDSGSIDMGSSDGGMDMGGGMDM